MYWECVANTPHCSIGRSAGVLVTHTPSPGPTLLLAVPSCGEGSRTPARKGLPALATPSFSPWIRLRTHDAAASSKCGWRPAGWLAAGEITEAICSTTAPSDVSHADA